VAVIAFEGNEFSGDLAPALADLQASGIVRVIDLAFVRKDATGLVTLVQVSDIEVASAYARIADPRFDLVSETDLSELTASLRPASSALVVVWENSWAARFASAARESHGEVAAFERIPYETVWRALTALEE
jgi:Family of unknown function (DUF6325)